MRLNVYNTWSKYTIIILKCQPRKDPTPCAISQRIALASRFSLKLFWSWVWSILELWCCCIFTRRWAHPQVKLSHKLQTLHLRVKKLKHQSNHIHKIHFDKMISYFILYFTQYIHLFISINHQTLVWFSLMVIPLYVVIISFLMLPYMKSAWMRS